MKNSNKQSNEERRFKGDPNQVVSMYQSGMTAKEIGDKFGVSAMTIGKIIRSAGISRPACRRKGVFCGENNSQWSGGRRKRADGYILIWTPDGERLEHRVIMEKKIGSKLTEEEVVHHIDEDPSNNDPENLQLFSSQQEHAQHHGIAIRNRLIDAGTKICTGCHLPKLLDDFYRVSSRPHCYQSWCKKCKNERDKIAKATKRAISFTRIDKPENF